MSGLSRVAELNLIEVFNYYLILAFVAGTGIRIRTYLGLVGLVYASSSRWPKLVELVKKHRTIFLGWPMLLSVGCAFALLAANSLAMHFVWVSARVTWAQLADTRLPLLAVALSGGLMLFLDGQAIFRRGRFHRSAVEKDLDKAESWLESWMSPTLSVLTFGLVSPRKIVGAKVHQLLVDANWILIGGMRRTSLRIGMHMIFGLSLWLAWAFALPRPA
jgi:hypothetical protein